MFIFEILELPSNIKKKNMQDTEPFRVETQDKMSFLHKKSISFSELNIQEFTDSVTKYLHYNTFHLNKFTLGLFFCGGGISFFSFFFFLKTLLFMCQI